MEIYTRTGMNRDQRYDTRTYKTYGVGAENAGMTVEEFLRSVAGVSARGFQKLARSRGLFLNTRPTYSGQKLKAGDVVKTAILSDDSFGANPEPGAISILYEDADLIALDKPPGQLVHPTGQTSAGTLANRLAFEFMRRGLLCKVRPIHRLDRDTSGCVLFAKDAGVQSTLEKNLAAGGLKRTYVALVKGVPESAGVIDEPIGPHPRLPNRRVVAADGERAITHYKVLECFTRAALVELELETGRTHQIRVHMAHIGHPVLGDRMYGGKSSLIDRQALHARGLRFSHPRTGSPVTIEAPLPGDMAAARAKMTERASDEV